MVRTIAVTLSFVCLAFCANVLCFGSAAIAAGDHYVHGHVTRNGTFVAPHFQTNPNSTRQDNFSTRGNSNPYTGKRGTRNPY